MHYIKERVITGVNAGAIAQFLALGAFATILPFYIHLQWATGPIVNAILVIALFLIGIRSAMVLALIPSIMALAGGLIPAALAPAVPFIMISNIVFILVIDWFYNNLKDEFKGYWIGVIAAATIKFIFLFSSVTFITPLMIKSELALKVAQMMSWPQFATALTGGMIAWGVLKWLKRI